MTDTLSTEIRGPIMIATLTRPRKLNALNGPMTQALKVAHEHFAASADLRVMLIKAEGRYFSAGADITADLIPGEDVGGQSGFRAWYRASTSSLHPMLDGFEACEKPIVVAHHGPCLGGALEISLSCDFRLAAQSARYGLPEIELGALPGSGGISRLTRIVGPAWARWLAMAGESVTAEQALSMGLVHAVYSDETFEAETMAFCERLASRPPEALAAAKLAIELIADLDRTQGRNVERLAVGNLVMGSEFKEALAAVRERLKSRS